MGGTALIRPRWLKTRIPSGETYANVRRTIRRHNLNTVCQEASCPNVAECWGAGTATIMIMGDTCTRGCGFCDVNTGRPGALDVREPAAVAGAIRDLNLRYAVITSVCRDDLPDGGAGHFAETIRQIRHRCPGTMVESLIPDFAGDHLLVDAVADAGPHVVGHNIETVSRLSRRVRDCRADYHQSLQVLSRAKRGRPRIFTKSSMMLGLGESTGEILAAAADLRESSVDFVALGQYMQPSARHLPVSEYVHPDRFDHLKRMLYDMGFLHVAAGPFVRSSFRASDMAGIVSGRRGVSPAPYHHDALSKAKAPAPSQP